MPPIHLRHVLLQVHSKRVFRDLEVVDAPIGFDEISVPAKVVAPYPPGFGVSYWNLARAGASSSDALNPSVQIRSSSKATPMTIMNVLSQMNEYWLPVKPNPT